MIPPPPKLALRLRRRDPCFDATGTAATGTAATGTAATGTAATGVAMGTAGVADAAACWASR